MRSGRTWTRTVSAELLATGGGLQGIGGIFAGGPFFAKTGCGLTALAGLVFGRILCGAVSAAGCWLGSLDDDAATEDHNRATDEP